MWMPIFHGLEDVWAFGLTLPPFILPWAGYCLGRSSCPSSPLDFYFCYSSSCHAYGHVGCQSYHVGPLGLLPLSLSFLGPFTLHLSLINPMGLLATIPAMLAHWVYYLYLWASLTHLLYLYLLLIPWTC